MTRISVSRLLLLASALLLVIAVAGCLQTTERSDDRVESGETAPAPDDAGDDGNDGDGAADAEGGDGGQTADDGSEDDATEGPGTDGDVSTDGTASTTDDGGTEDGGGVAPPETIGDRAVERATWRRIDRLRDSAGVRDADWSQGLGVEPARAANVEMKERGATPLTLETGEAFAASSRDLLELFREEGVTSCTGLSKDVAGQVSAVIDVRPHSDATNPRDAATTAERVADHVVKAWRDDPSTEAVITGAYRYVGVDALYDAETGSLYMTAALC